jgi:hypothetical protein
MNRICWSQRLVVCAALLGVALWGSSAAAQEVQGRTFKTFIYSGLVAEPSTMITFEPNGTLLMDLYDGMGLYLALGSTFTGVYWAPDFDEKDDLLLVISGAVITDFLGGIGIAFTEYQFSEIFFYVGYAE